MKITYLQTNKLNVSGSVLLLALIISIILGLTMAAYMRLTSLQNSSVMRSLSWNATVPVLEAGIEESLAHINKNSTWSADGWTLENNLFMKKRELSVGDTYYEVAISNVNPPVIYAHGYVKIPGQDDYLKRSVKVDTVTDALFAKGMVAKGQINLNGNNIKTDSFDSSDPSWSTGGVYDPNKIKDNGDVATNSGLVDSLSVGNANIYGKVSTGPGGNVSIGNNGAVGSATWHADGNSGIEPGFSSDDMNVSFPDATAPFSTGATPVGGFVGTAPNQTYYDLILTSGDYEVNGLSLSGSSKVLVAGHARLLVKGDFQMSGKSTVNIATNASLNMYVAGTNGSIGGNGIMNNAAKATNFFYWGLPSNKNLSFSGNAAFTGVIYAPHAEFQLNGGGNNTYDFIGASITDSVQMNGHFNFHYDEDLQNSGPSRGFVISDWEEI